MNKNLKITLLSMMLVSSTYAANQYTVIISPDKSNIVFVSKPIVEVPPVEEIPPVEENPIPDDKDKIEIISFTVDSNTVNKGDISKFDWSIKNAVTLKFNGQVIDNKTTSRNVTQSNSGNFNYILEGIDSFGNSEQRTLTVDVADVNMITSFTVDKPVVSNTNTSLVFTWDMPTPTTLKLTNNLGYSALLTKTLKTVTYGRVHPIGDTIYTLEATNEEGKVFTKSVTVKSVAIPVINSFEFPSVIYGGQTYALNFNATNATSYQIRSSSSYTGFPSTFVDATSGVQKTVCGVCEGTFNIVLAAYNEAGGSASITKPLTIEASPTATIAMINNVRYQNTVAPNTALTFDVFSKSAGSTLVRKATNSATAAVVAFPTNAPAAVGTYPYYISACKTVNNEERCSVPLTATVIVK